MMGGPFAICPIPRGWDALSGTAFTPTSVDLLISKEKSIKQQ
jgi:hypothetical protein